MLFLVQAAGGLWGGLFAAMASNPPLCVYLTDSWKFCI